MKPPIGSIRAIALLISMSALAACGGDEDVNGPGEPGPASRLAFATQPSDVMAGTAISPAVQVTVLDAEGRTATSASNSVTLEITAGTGANGAVLAGTLTRAAVGGVVNFNDVTLDKAGTGYTLTATAAGLASAISTAVEVTPGAPAKLAFLAPPSDVAAGMAITPPVQAVVQDARGNTNTAETVNVTVAIGTNPAGGSLSGTTTVTATGGVASFSDLEIDKPGTGYTLTVTASGMSGATSAEFDVTGQGVLDQAQLVYNGGTSARTLPGYTVWQSFIAGVSGTLVEIDMGFFNDMSGSGQLQILSGDGTAGPVLQTLTVSVVGITRPDVTWNQWVVNVPVTAGAHYTFKFTPDAATLPDPYGVAIGANNPYAGGVMGLDDPSGSYRTDFDLVFRTFVR